MGMEADQNLEGQHTMQCTDGVLQNCTPDTYTGIMLLTNVAVLNLIKK